MTSPATSSPTTSSSTQPGNARAQPRYGRPAGRSPPGGICLSVDDGTPKLLATDLTLLQELAETKAIRPVIDRCYRLEQMAEAHRYVDGGHKKGNVVVTVST
jgi:NADPH:quinone reductase-like Zn-dependent oxidoreductase